MVDQYIKTRIPDSDAKSRPKKETSGTVSGELNMFIKVTKDIRISVPTLTPAQHLIMYRSFRSQFPDTAVFLQERLQSLALHAQVIPPIVFVPDTVIDFFFTPRGEEASLASLFAKEPLIPLTNFRAAGKYHLLSTVLSWVNKPVTFYRGHYLRFRHVNNTLYINMNTPPHLDLHGLIHAALFDWTDLPYQLALDTYLKFVRTFLSVQNSATERTFLNDPPSGAGKGE
jgi:hypothetical protein